ncbi:hypothetical protein ACS0TY_026780 [Phlomoides rotata]
MLLRGGAFSGCSAAVGDSNVNRRFPGVIRPPTAVCRPRRVQCVKSVAAGEPIRKPEELSHHASLANRLRLGGFTEDGLAYKGIFIVRSYEVGINKTITIQTITNLLQEVGVNHYQRAGYSTDGFGTTPIMRKLSLIWVVKRMHIEIYKYPGWSDVFEIESWFHIEAIGSRRDFIIRDYVSGEVIGRATSKWIAMNYETRRLQKIPDELRNEVKVYAPKTFRLAFPEENNASLNKIAKLDDPAGYSELGIVPRRSDLDMNQHVNHVSYIGWILESMPQKIINSHELQAITLDFRRECQHDDEVDSLTSSELVVNGNSKSIAKEEDDYPQFLHLLRLSKDANEICRARTVWTGVKNLQKDDMCYN